MAHYRYCHLILYSEMPLPELPRVYPKHTQCDDTIRLKKGHTILSMPDNWAHRWRTSDGQVSILYARDERGHFLRFPGLADFAISKDCHIVQCHFQASYSEETGRHLLLDQVLPRVLGQRGHLVLHASAVLTPFGAVGFVGSSGSGKSTLAASFAGNGSQMVADDCLLLEPHADQVVCVASYPGSRLWPDSVACLFASEREVSFMADYSGKQRVGMHFAHSPDTAGTFELVHLYMLEPPTPRGDDSPTMISPRAKRDSFLKLVTESFHLDVTSQDQLRQTFFAIEHAVHRVPIFNLRFPRDHSHLPNVRKEILTHLSTHRTRPRPWSPITEEHGQCATMT
jgi:hypothetical protein